MSEVFEKAVYSASAVAFGAVFLYKLRHLSADWANARRWTLAAATLLPTLASGMAPPAIQVWVNRVTGVPNIAQVLCADFSVAAAASWLSLALLWRYPMSEAWLRIRWVLPVYALDIVVLTVMFAVSDVPLERLDIEFSTYYVPRQLTIFVYYLLFLLPITLGAGTLAVWCLVWSRRASYAGPPRLRRSLFLLGVVGACLSVGFVLQLAAVVAVRFESNTLDGTALVAMLSALLVVIVLFPFALIYPLRAPLWRALRDRAERWRAFLALRPLYRTLRPVDPSIVVVSLSRRWDSRHRVRRMVIELNDWRWMLFPLFDPELAKAVARHAKAAGLGDEQIEAVVEAVQLRAAYRAWSDGVRVGGSGSSGEEVARDGVGIESEIAWWLRVARAFARCDGAVDSAPSAPAPGVAARIGPVPVDPAKAPPGGGRGPG